jgi:hypothetical protein
MMDCSYFEGCTAPLCPKDAGNAQCAWFADEEICRLADVPEWVKRQRKVSRKAAPEGCFTVAMLKQDCRIYRGIKGIDPDGSDRERAADEMGWFKAHPVITEEEREKMRATGLKNKGLFNGSACKNDRYLTGLDVDSGEKGSYIPPALD